MGEMEDIIGEKLGMEEMAVEILATLVQIVEKITEKSGMETWEIVVITCCATLVTMLTGLGVFVYHHCATHAPEGNTSAAQLGAETQAEALRLDKAREEVKHRNMVSQALGRTDVYSIEMSSMDPWIVLLPSQGVEEPREDSTEREMMVEVQATGASSEMGQEPQDIYWECE